MSVGPPTDPGLQLERTQLAWRRTNLALVVGGSVGARLTMPEWGTWGVAAGGTVALTGLLAHVWARRRGQLLRRAQVDTSAPSPGAQSLLALVLGTVSITVAAAVFVLV